MHLRVTCFADERPTFNEFGQLEIINKRWLGL